MAYLSLKGVFDWRPNLSLRRGSSLLIIVGAFERLFCPEGREFEQTNLQKFKCLGGWGCPGGDAELSNWSVHNANCDVAMAAVLLPDLFHLGMTFPFILGLIQTTIHSLMVSEESEHKLYECSYLVQSWKRLELRVLPSEFSQHESNLQVLLVA